MNVDRLIHLYTDEDVDIRLASQLTLRGFDALSCRDAGNANRSLSDDWQLHYATEHGRVILTHDVGDYLRLVKDWDLRGEEYAGVILAHTAELSLLIRCVEWHLRTHYADHHHNLVLHLLPLP